MGASTDIRHIWRARQEMGGTDHPGWRLNNLTTTQRDALTGSGAAKAGDIIWNTTTSAVEYYDGSNWSGVPISVSEAELGVIDGASSTPTASKVTVATASGWAAWRRPVVEDGANVVLTAADSGALCVFDKTDGALFTLPTPAIGLWYEFVVDTVDSTGGHKVITNAGTVFIQGTVMLWKLSDSTNLACAANGSTHVAINMDGTTKGGIAGTRFKLVCRTATKWEIEGTLYGSGTIATPFATS